MTLQDFIQSVLNRPGNAGIFLRDHLLDPNKPRLDRTNGLSIETSSVFDTLNHEEKNALKPKIYDENDRLLLTYIDLAFVSAEIAQVKKGPEESPEELEKSTDSPVTSSVVTRYSKQFTVAALAVPALAFGIPAATMFAVEAGTGIGSLSAVTSAMPFLGFLTAVGPVFGVLAFAAILAVAALVVYGLVTAITHAATKNTNRAPESAEDLEVNATNTPLAGLKQPEPELKTQTPPPPSEVKHAQAPTAAPDESEDNTHEDTQAADHTMTPTI